MLQGKKNSCMHIPRKIFSMHERVKKIIYAYVKSKPPPSPLPPPIPRSKVKWPTQVHALPVWIGQQKPRSSGTSKLRRWWIGTKIAEDGIRFLNSLAYSWAMSSVVFYAFCTRASGKKVYQLGQFCALLGGAHEDQPIMSLHVVCPAITSLDVTDPYTRLWYFRRQIYTQT